MPVNTPNNQPLLVAYGQSQPLINVGQLPVISNRNPGVNDRKAIGSIWVNKLLNTAWIETSVANAQANWIQVEASGGAGVFNSLTVTGTTSLVGTTGINLAGAFATQIGVGGTGPVTIGNTTGNTAIVGNLVVSGSITSTAGNITATNGNLVANTLGNKLVIATAASGTNASVGKTVAMAAGTVVVATTAVTANSIILVSHATAAGTMGNLSIGTITPGVSFAILTDNVLDTSTVNFLIIN